MARLSNYLKATMNLWEITSMQQPTISNMRHDMKDNEESYYYKQKVTVDDSTILKKNKIRCKRKLYFDKAPR